jgi:tyrosine-protein kinase Etk/Wzc
MTMQTEEIESSSQIVQPRPSEPADDGAGMTDLLAVVTARRRLVLWATIAGGAAAAIVALILPNTYTAAAMILPPQKEQSAAAMLAGQLGPLAAVAGADLGLKNPAEMYVGLLKSRTIADRVIEKFQLRELYREKTLTETRAELSSRTHLAAGRDSLIRIEVKDHDPARAAAMANMYVSELQEQNKRLAVSEAGQRRAFLEQRLADEKVALAAAEDAMKETQQRSGMIEVTGQTHVAIGSMAQLRAQVTAGEVALQRLKMGATAENPAVLQVEAEVAALREQLRKLERAPEQGALLSASSIPAAGLNYIRRLRELKYHEFLFELLSKQYEAARFDESKAAPPLQVVDLAVPPDKKSGPLRALITGLGALVGGLAGAFAAILLQYRKTAGARRPASA